MKTFIKEVASNINNAEGGVDNAIIIGGTIAAVGFGSFAMLGYTLAFIAKKATHGVVDGAITLVDPEVTIKHTTSQWDAIEEHGFEEAHVETNEGVTGFQRGEDVVSFGAANQGIYSTMVERINARDGVQGELVTKKITVKYSELRRINISKSGAIPWMSAWCGHGIEATVSREVINARIDEFEVCDTSGENHILFSTLMVAMAPLRPIPLCEFTTPLVLMGKAIHANTEGVRRAYTRFTTKDSAVGEALAKPSLVA